MTPEQADETRTKLTAVAVLLDEAWHALVTLRDEGEFNAPWEQGLVGRTADRVAHASVDVDDLLERYETPKPAAVTS